jgi:hypothetical protein
MVWLFLELKFKIFRIMFIFNIIFSFHNEIFINGARRARFIPGFLSEAGFSAEQIAPAEFLFRRDAHFL